MSALGGSQEGLAWTAVMAQAGARRPPPPPREWQEGAHKHWVFQSEKERDEEGNERHSRVDRSWADPVLGCGVPS